MKVKIIRAAILVLWCSFISGAAFIWLWFYMVSNNTGDLFGPMPNLEALENPKSNISSELYTSDGVLIGKYYRENRTNISYNEISPNVINALVATEDIRFEKHSGIDLQGSFAIFWYLLKGDKRGSSTISQQLSKNLFKTRGAKYEGSLAKKNNKLRLVINKTKEWISAIQIERSYTKKEIMTMYLNTVDFGSNSFGIVTASQTFFSIPQDSLNINQAAMLVGLLKAPSLYSPVYNPENAIARRNTVLEQLNKYKYISDAQFATLSAQPIALKYEVENHNKGSATYFRSYITRYLISWCNERGIDLYEDGIKIYTTIDSKIQAYAEASVSEHMKYLQGKFFAYWKGKTPWRDEEFKEIPNFIEKAARHSDRWRMFSEIYDGDTAKVWSAMNRKISMKVFSWNGEIDTLLSPIDSIRYYKHFLHAGMLSMDPHSGQIKAWVGGIDHKHFKYDHVKQGSRQPGSTFKPFVYTAAIDLGYSPCYELPDLPVTFKTEDINETWTPQNSDGAYSGEMFSIRKAMANSINSITANLIKKVGPETVVDYATRMGITTPLEPVPALCLGVFDVTLYDMVGAYSTFVNQGVWTEPIFITRIEDKNGNILQNFVPKTKEVLSEETAYLMVHMLKGATEEKGGTALGLNKYGLLWNGAEIGGKTGTTQNYSDGWFVGITTQLTTGIWVGGDDRSIHFRSMNDGQGARMAMPIWAIFMNHLYNDPKTGILKERFPTPASPLSVEINCKKFKEVENANSNTNPNSSVIKNQNIPDF
ncbi:penicillin-binding protein 1A [Cytophaga hutchinsonii]|jgi:penicillin-binding protein 1A|uniref:Candidate bifunctional family GT51 b-glycosyltransferase/PBP transpeptidase, candidate murein polymerase, Glycosyltransferase Family 51 protein n=1 Tax=Cytophaga hutchinsonii (strain ATCC 33406 / DSM 1761 / CIP 103989 / NBRC 15051 / NCIMB 9469 / D465) TaxID=269798 RepID=A0A6N4SMH6_CYTH3|nr:transglycosylase domain-containing protein [Cytophaga hutchinsonii]ABG57468.1 candidate bifunctional family GT51 b-glycosyltransferase/PBP transpeptidase, candidate murein polymerase, Glycosyltransferase Family 51 protein [Cytophaga hutchinsonii ATCC 33406]SFW98159.1 penicillin-binding protein 1A [Cytophaga hutchinsonii ATCC 33406]